MLGAAATYCTTRLPVVVGWCSGKAVGSVAVVDRGEATTASSSYAVGDAQSEPQSQREAWRGGGRDDQRTAQSQSPTPLRRPGRTTTSAPSLPLPLALALRSSLSSQAVSESPTTSPRLPSRRQDATPTPPPVLNRQCRRSSVDRRVDVFLPVRVYTSSKLYSNIVRSSLCDNRTLRSEDV